MEETKTAEKKQTKSWAALLIALAVFVISVCGAQAVDNQGGTITVQDLYITSSYDGALLHGKLYIPKNATAKTPAPTMIYWHGNDADGDKYLAFGIEAARRGYVVFMGDMRGQGSSYGVAGGGTGPNDTCGGNEISEYIRSLPFVDTKNLFLAGHSMGSSCCVATYKLHPEYYKAMVLHGGNAAALIAAVPDENKVNVFLSTARDDMDAKNLTNVAKFFNKGPASEFVSGKVYGSFEAGTARVNFQAMNSVHNSEYIDPQVVEASINFIQSSMKAPNPIDGSNQVWYMRYIFTSIAFIAFVFMVLPLGNILLNTAFFGKIRREVPEYKGNTKTRWWIFAVFTAVFGPLMYFFWSNGDPSITWVPKGIFTVKRAAVTLNWSGLIALVTVAVMVGGYFLTKKADRPGLVNYGITYEKGQNLVNILKSLLLAFIIVLALYSLLAVTYKWTLVDVRIWNSCFKVLSDYRVGRMLVYVIPFSICYFVLAANLHGTLRPKNGKISIVKETLINILIIAPWYWIWAIWFGPFAWLKEAGATPAFKGQMYAFFWAVPVMMAIIGTISTYFFRKTGRIYVGAFLNGLLVSWLLIGGFSNLWTSGIL